MAASTGQGSITVSQKQNKVPPFPASAAHNGLSVDAAGFIVLGNEVGDNLAMVVTPREIPMNGNFIRLLEAQTQMELYGDQVLIANNVDFQTNARLIAGIMDASLVLQSDTSIGKNAPFVEINDASGSLNQIVANGFLLDITQNGDRSLSLDKGLTIFQIGDLDGAAQGTTLSLDAGTGQSYMGNNTTGDRLQQWNLTLGTNVIGDVTNATTGTQEIIDTTTGIHDFSNTAGNALYSINGNPGISGTFAPPASITVEGGIIVAAS